LDVNYSVQGPPLRQTIGRLVVLDLLRISFRKLVSLWLELLVDADIIESRSPSTLSSECHELPKIFSALATAKGNR
jgi:hypothetical protein